jgi:predicted deacylase
VTPSPPTPCPVGIAPPDLSRWRESATGVPYVHEIASGAPGPEVLLAALVHGNEISGAIALDDLLASGIKPSRGRVTAMFCNVAAFDTFNRASPDASRFVDEDFNRVWGAARLDGPGDSIELRRARELRTRVERSTHLLDLHSMHEPCEPLFITGSLPRDIGFASRLDCAARIVIDGGHAQGMRMRDHEGTGAGSARISLLLEAGQHWDPRAVLVARDVVMRFLVMSGAFPAGDVPPGWLQPDALQPRPIQVTHGVVARSPDFAFAQPFTGGEVIARAGTAIAFDAGEHIVTPYDNCVLVMPSVRQLRPGVTTVRFGRQLTAG